MDIFILREKVKKVEKMRGL